MVRQEAEVKKHVCLNGRGNMKQYEHRHQDDLDWWTRRYKALCTTKVEEVVRKAAKLFNQATKLCDKDSRLATELDREVETRRNVRSRDLAELR